jgi:hypothetical protein
MDPLAEDDALREAQLLDIRCDATRTTLGLLFDLRTALQLEEGNTGVLVGHGLRELAWSAGARVTAFTAWSVMTSAPRWEDGLLSLRLGMYPRADLDLVVERASFHVIDIPGIGETPPDYGSDEDTVAAGLPNWQSHYVGIHGTFADSAPASR